MKCFKKVAALLFCVALALSVMAVGAFADDEAELLAVTVNNNTDFVVTLEKATSTVLDRDSTATGVTNNGYEINIGDSVAFNIKLAYNGTGEGAYTPYNTEAGTGDKINSFQFDFTAGDKETVSALVINGGTVTHKSGDLGNYANTYAYTSQINGDINMPGSEAVTIGTITFNFPSSNNAVTQNTPITPSITNIQIQVLETEQTELVSETTNDATSAAVVKTPYPIWVNPQYTATVQHFDDADASGIISLDVNNTNYVVYDFSTGNAGATTDALTTAPTATVVNLNKLTNEARFPGYTFKGWMVTAENASDTWAAYDSTAAAGSQWTKNVSYSTSTDWATNSGSSKDNLATSIAAFTDGTTTPVNFIPVNASGTTTTIPAGYVGNITLTPVYVADVYTATFNAGAAKATFGASHSATTDSTTGNFQYTKTYTIEDLYDTTGSQVADFLDIQRDSTKTSQNRGLKRTGYKFVGWTLNTTTSASSVESEDTAYNWTKDSFDSTVITDVKAGKTRVNSTDVITMAVAKRYGNITFTAEWELDIYFAKINYTYSGPGNVMILVGVPKAREATNPLGNNYDTTGKYTYQYKQDASNTFDMFKVPEGNQRTAYVTAATTETTINPYFTSANLTSSYDIYAYIAPTNTLESAILLDEDATTDSRNGALAYTGDVDNSGSNISVGDFGNVDSVLRAVTATTPVQSNVFSIATRDGVKARLQADFDSSDSASNFGTIADIKGIYNLMGYDLT